MPDITECDFVNNLKAIKLRNLHRLVIAHININSIRNKIELLSSAVIGNIDILMISETKIDDTFPTNQFVIKGFYTPFRFDRSSNGGGILVYIWEDIPAKLLVTSYISNNTECLAIEINLRKTKWLLLCSYNPHKNNILKHLKNLSDILDKNSAKYERLLCMGDFNSQISESAMSDFCRYIPFKNLVNVPTCFKNPENPTCIDLFLTNCPKKLSRNPGTRIRSF